jgi:hypothetical protein
VPAVTNSNELLVATCANARSPPSFCKSLHSHFHLRKPLQPQSARNLDGLIFR